MRILHPRNPSHVIESVQKIYDFMITPVPNLRFNWILKLGDYLEREGLTDVKLEKHAISPHLESFHNRLKLLTCEEAISSMPASDMTEQLRTVLEKANTEMRMNGAVLTWGYVLALGMKPG